MMGSMGGSLSNEKENIISSEKEILRKLYQDAMNSQRKKSRPFQTLEDVPLK